MIFTTLGTAVGDQAMPHPTGIVKSSHFSIVNSGLVLDPHQPFPMSELEALKKGPPSPVGPNLSPDIRHAEALKRLMEKSMGSETSTGQRDGDAILRWATTAANNY